MKSDLEMKVDKLEQVNQLKMSLSDIEQPTKSTLIPTAILSMLLCHFTVFSLDCTLHTAITHVIAVLERRSLAGLWMV